MVGCERVSLSEDFNPSGLQSDLAIYEYNIPKKMELNDRIRTCKWISPLAYKTSALTIQPR